MAILVDKETRLIVQGITGKIGSSQTKRILEYGTKIVAGVTPGKVGMEIHGISVYNTVKDALVEHPANASILFVPSNFTFDAAKESIEAGISLIVIVAEGIPIHDAIKIKALAEKSGTIVIGPNTGGLISPGKAKVGVMASDLFFPGPVGIVSRSGTLTQEFAINLTHLKIGQSTCIGVGGDAVIGTDFSRVIEMFERDPETRIIVMVGEIGGTAEEEVARIIIRQGISKPVIAYISGWNVTIPEGKRMGHAGAIIGRGRGTAESKIRALREAGVKIAKSPDEAAKLVKEAIELL